MSVDEQRIVALLRRLAANYEERAQRRPFSFDRVRAKLCLDLARAIEAGQHR